MKLVIALFFSMLFILPAHAQKETYDLLTYTAPAKWVKEISNNNITYTISDTKTNGWCRINIIKSTISKGDIEADFESEWQEIIVKSYKPTDKPTASEVLETDGRLNDKVGQGWKIKAGNAKFIFNSKDAMVMLITASGYGRCVSIVTVTNSQNYLTDIEALLASVNLIKPEVNSSLITIKTIADSVITGAAKGSDNSNNLISGSWGKSNTVGQINNRFGNYSYNKQQYTFNANGTYYFNAKNYGEQYNETILIKESGTYLIDGNKLTITPKRSVIEAWSKKNGSDNWNQLKSSQARKLETATYQFSIADKNLRLQIAAATERDGFFNNGNTYSYGPPGTFTAIKLPGE
jgi:hypothetical protein